MALMSVQKAVAIEIMRAKAESGNLACEASLLQITDGSVYHPLCQAVLFQHTSLLIFLPPYRC